MNCGGIITSGMMEQIHESAQRWEDQKKKLLEDVKGTPEAKLVRLIFNQHEIQSFDHHLDGFQCEETGKFFNYRITYKDHESLSSEHVSNGCGIGLEYNPAPTHVMYFKNLTIK